MKKVISLSLVLALLPLIATLTFASPIMPAMDKYSFFVTASSFGGGDIEGYELPKHDGMGMGANIPITSVLNAGIRFGSETYSDNNFAIQASLLPKEDGYLYRIDFNRFGGDGSIGHLGVYRDFPGEQTFHLCGGGGLSFISMHGAPKNTYLSMYVELQARAAFSEDFFGYGGISYDYHLGATTIEAGVGMTI